MQIFDMHISADAFGLAGGGLASGGLAGGSLAGAASGTVRAGLGGANAAGSSADGSGLPGVPSLFASHLDVATAATPVAGGTALEGMSVSAAALLDGASATAAPVLNFSAIALGVDGGMVRADAGGNPSLLLSTDVQGDGTTEADAVTLVGVADGMAVAPPAMPPVMFPVMADIALGPAPGSQGEASGGLGTLGNLGESGVPPVPGGDGGDAGAADRPPVASNAASGTVAPPGFFPGMADAAGLAPAGAAQPGTLDPSLVTAGAPSGGGVAATASAGIAQVGIAQAGRAQAGIGQGATSEAATAQGVPGQRGSGQGSASQAAAAEAALPSVPATPRTAGQAVAEAVSSDPAVSADATTADETDGPVLPLRREAAVAQKAAPLASQTPAAQPAAPAATAQPAPAGGVQTQAAAPVAQTQAAPQAPAVEALDLAQAADMDGALATEAAKRPVETSQPLRAATATPASGQNGAAQQAANAQAGVQNMASQNLAGQNLAGQTSLAGDGQFGEPASDTGDGTADAGGTARAQLTTPMGKQDAGGPTASSTMAVQTAAAATLAPGLEGLGDGLMDAGDGFETVLAGMSRSGQATVTPAVGGSAPAQTLPMALMAMEITRNAQRGVSRFEIRLDPPELGRVDVRLKIGDDGQVRAHLIVERPETLDMMQRDQRGMERALENAGLKTASDGGLSFSLKDQGGQAFADDGNGARDTQGFTDAADAGDQPVDQQAALERVAAYPRGGAAGLDIRV